MKGVFQQKPSPQRYTVTWDPVLLLNFLKTQPLVEKLSLKMLTLKTVTLVTILSAQRIQTAHLLDIHNMLVSDSVVKISIGISLNKPGHVITSMNLNFQLTPLIINFVKF